ncbi:acetolactate synthase large subunit [Pelagicoccus sp. NFK12]|uniref:Acetolactate synthase large subunit n=1 Tax=Pelagicoccus enzymogenes TaxID=2773457 RepID=A0A927IJ17_9BACT|nr:acetolactate synthase large subunit [Pelagicoccus enzymogenes]MBD5781348.1 acetolactate synthase large subunit [Pelagicoccus enzymogenes]MDQ8199608.1 acetolactate synthase large subunit [Pelagicoccus enzymogenes]
MKASDLFVACLESEGVEYVFGVPGEENIDFLDSLSRSRIKFVLTRHEQSAGFMASTYGRLTGKTGVCLSTLGPGATNLVTAGAYAQLGAMPLLMITGQKPINSSKQGQFQIIDVVDMMAPITKRAKQVVSGSAIPSLVRNAFSLAEEERPGAVHLELPEDVAREEVGEGKPIKASARRRPVAEEKSILQACELLRSSRRPILLVGAGANRKRTSKMLRAFAEKQGIPFVTTQMGKGVIDERSELFLGNAALSDNDFPHRALACSDLILNVGHDVVEKPPFFMNSGERTVIHVNFVPAETDPVYFPQAEVIGDIANSVWQINERLEPQSHWDFDFALRTREAARRYREPLEADDRFPMLPQRLVALLREAMPHDGVLALDNGVYKLWFARDYPAVMPNTVLLDNALASMGAGLPSAIAAKLVDPGKKVVAVCGDGGFMMNSQDLETAVRLELDLVVLILNDSAYGMIRWKQEDMGFKDFGLTFGNPDFVSYAESYGAKGHRIEASEDLLPRLERCFEEGGVHVVDLPVDYSLNVKTLFEEIPEASREVG